MDKQKALEILIEGINLAQKSGAYTLKDASVLAQAITILTTPEVKEEIKSNEME